MRQLRKSLVSLFALFAASISLTSGLHAQTSQKMLETSTASRPTQLLLPPVTYTSGVGSPYFVTIVDINGDGKLDLLVANNAGGAGSNGSVAVLLGNGDGTFEPAVSYDSGGQQPVFIALADINGDGKLDLAVANSLSQTVGVMLGKGDGSFQPVVVYNNTNPITNKRGRYPVSIAFGDVNQDQKLDMIVANEIGRTVSVLFGNGDGTFQTKRPLSDTGGPEGDASSMFAIDSNNDGVIDYLVLGVFGAQFGQNEVHVLYSDGAGNFLQPATRFVIGGQKSVAIAMGDVNKDGAPDVVAVSDDCYFSYAPSCVAVLLGNNTGNFALSSSGYLSGGNNASSIALADVDGDGNLDAIVANGDDDGNVGVLFGHGDGTLGATLTFPTGGGKPSSVAVADLNGDGAPDVVVANMASGTVGVLLKNPQPKFSTTIKLVSSQNPAIYGQDVTFTATVKSTAGGIPDNETVFFNVDTSSTSGSTHGGVAALTVSLPPGTHIIKATYPSAPPVSATLHQVVKKSATTVTLTSSLNPSTVGQKVTFTAQVAAAFAPTGHVVFKDGATTIGSQPLADGAATLNYSKFTAGMHSIKAEYKGDAVNAESTSPVLNQAVNP